MAKKFNENLIIYAVLAIAVILFLQQPTGLFSTVDITETYPCPAEATEETVPLPCEGAIWVDTPTCAYDITNCEGFCDADADCIIDVPAPNDCSLMWKPYNLTQIGFCENQFCTWLEIPDTESKCSAFDLFLQKYKWILLGLIIFLVAFVGFEKDFGGKKRGFI